ncbi:acyl carrier protein [Hoeflea sp. IMCC20628]|uniref:acyl carrier protein n=1 Tax=Hoeflea sp. IMCC20628 TaxID=1620421 RepID=UPI00063AE15A|nr:acyl carrier protein [Hoeflea sp. IMCC20628]AKI01946.1 acyl carrier protein [Hoeflea sp. IMCC20628]
MIQNFADVRTILATYTETPIEEFDMSEDLDLTYDMDSTELTDFAKQLTQQYGVVIAKSDRADWTTGNDIVAFLKRAASNTDHTAAV